MIKKSDLPQKQCPVCDRPFRWRNKWRKVWDEVRYCSKRCQQSTNKNKNNGFAKPSD